MKSTLYSGKTLILCLLIIVLQPANALDFSKSEDNLSAFIKMRCSLEQEDVFTWWYGTLFAKIPSKKAKPLMKFEGYNVCKMIPQEDGSYHFVTREVTYYQDLKTGKIIEKWENPLNGKTVDIVHVANDPVSHKYPSPAKVPFKFPWRIVGDDMMLTLNIPLAYPNALQPDEFPDESTGKEYIASEHFTFFGKLSEVSDPKIRNASLTYGWSRTGPWLPWMKMGTSEGALLYSAQGAKLKNGFDDLPENIKNYTRKNYAKFMKAPDKHYGPNETSWTYYKKLKQKGNSEKK